MIRITTITHLFLFVAFIGISHEARCQDNTIGHPKVLSAKEVTWYGIDCTKMQCIGKSGFTDTDDIADNIVFSWTDLVIQESKKYSIHEIFRKDEFKYDVDCVHERNEQVDGDNLIVTEAVELTESEIEEIVQSCVGGEGSVGVLFIVETLNKLETEAKVVVVLFDPSSGTIYRQKKYTGDPGGFGFRNYWAGAFHDIMDQMEDEYKKWYKKNK